MKTVAIVLAAGRGKRMQSDVAKQYLLIQDRPVLFYTLKAFEESPVDEVVLVTASEEIEYCRQEIVDRYGISKVKQIVAGGKERYHSVYQGLCAIEECDYVLVHDGARPFPDAGMFERILTGLKNDNAVVTGMPSKDTVKIADEEDYVKQTPNRKDVWMIQTPQAFSFSLIKKAYDVLISNEREIIDQGIQITDDSMVVEHFTGVKVRLVEGSYCNIKITTPEDLLVAETFLKKYEKSC